MRRSMTFSPHVLCLWFPDSIPFGLWFPALSLLLSSEVKEAQAFHAGEGVEQEQSVRPLAAIATSVLGCFPYGSVSAHLPSHRGPFACRCQPEGRGLAIYQGTAFDVYYVLGGVVGLIISAAMLRSTIFSKVTTYVGILIARRLFQPGQGVSKEEANRN
jgi:hypothetical protein